MTTTTPIRLLAPARGFISAVLLAATLPLTSSAQTNPITTGLQLWLKADAGVTTNASGLVTAWADQSGNGNNAAPVNGNTTYSPTYLLNSQNGLPTLRFPGGSKALDVQDVSTLPTSTISTLTNNVTIIIVKEDDSYSGYRAGISKSFGNAPGPFDFYNNSGVNGGATTFFLRNGTANVSFNGNSFKPQPGVYQVMSFTYANGSVTHYLNDAVCAYYNAGMQPNANPASIWNASNNSGPLRIGSRQDFVTQLVGNMAEVLIYQPALSTSQLLNVVTNYLQPKWNLHFDLPLTVAITSPVNGGTAAANSVIPVNISATNLAGSVTSVSVYGNGYLLGSNVLPPYNLGVSCVTPGSLTLTAVAYDAFNKPTTSAPVNLTITGQAAPSLPPTDGLMLWLNAGSGVTTNADGTVAAWVDESNNGNTAMPTPNAPYATSFATTPPVYVANAINGQPALHFNGTNSLLTVADGGVTFLTGDFTTLVVARFSQAFFTFNQMLWTKASNNLACPFDWRFPSGATIVYRGNGGAYGSIQSGVSTTQPLDQFINVGVRCQGTSVSMYDGAIPFFSGAIANATSDGTTGLPLTIGMRDDAGVGLYGDIAEILIYSNAQSSVTMTNIAAYLNGKYNLAQPFYASPPPVVAIASPTNGAVLSAPTAVSCTVSASSPLALITSVVLYANGAKVATFTNAPYTVQLELLTPGTVTFTAVATDNWGIQTTSLPAVVTLTGTVVTPPFTNGLGLWLKPDAGMVTDGTGNVIEWDDQSGNGNNAYQPSTLGITPGLPPVLLPNAANGHAVVHFAPPAGQNMFLDIANNGSVAPYSGTSFAIFAVTRVPAYGNYYEILADCNPSSIGYAGPFEYRLNTGTGLADYILGSGTANGPSVTASTAPPASSNLFNIEGVVVANGVITHYLNFNTNGAAAFSYTPLDLGNPLRVGGRGANNGTIYPMNGDIAELQVFTNAPNNSQVSQIFNYLADKYGVAEVQLAVQPPVIAVTAPTNVVTSAFTNGFAPGVLNIGAQISSAAPISSVSFIVNGQVVATETSPPYQIPLSLLSPGTLTIVIQAVDIWGISGSSAPFNITIPGNPGNLPAAPPMNGLVLWLKADTGVTTNADGTVANWADQSGNTNDASMDSGGAAAPTLVLDPAIGRPVLNFTPYGGPMCLDVADAPSVELVSDWSLFYTAQFTNFADTTLPSTIVAKTFGAQPYPLDYNVNVNRANCVRGNLNGNSTISSTGPIPAGQYVVGGVTVLSSQVTHYLDNVANGSGTFGYGALDENTSLKIGSRDDYLTQFVGNMAEILLYGRALTGSDLQLANTYLAGRSGIAIVQLDTQRPALSILEPTNGTVQVAYPTGYSGWLLQSSTNLTSWTTLAVNPTNNQVTVNPTARDTFYRLKPQ